jgi:uncharacterized protein
MSKKEVITRAALHIKSLLGKEGTGHDWWHVERVVRNAKHIAKKEGGDLFVIELAALLHDIADWKFHGGDTLIGPRKTREWLGKLKVEEDIISHVTDIVRNISFREGTNKTKMKTLEGRIVQDADRIDAIGAIGIARVFAYGGYRGREIYNPNIKPRRSYKSLKSNTTVNHFYEKLLLLKDRMNTKTGKKMAEERHKFIEQFLKQFYKEWGT